jgi:hypothetical protein
MPFDCNSAGSSQTHEVNVVCQLSEVLKRPGASYWVEQLKQIRLHTPFERAEGTSTKDATWSSPLLRTDSVKRGLCISLFTLEMIFLASSMRSCFFFIITTI